MTMREALEQALRMPEGQTSRQLEASGIAFANTDTTQTEGAA